MTMDLYYGMANLTDIEEMEDYARGWRELAEMFEAEGRPSMAETCRSRAVYYGAHPAGGLKRLAIQRKVYPARFAIPVLDREMSRLIATNGRNSELWLILRLYLKSRHPIAMLKMAPLGLKLIKTGRMSLRRETINNKKQLRSLVSAVREGAR